MEHDFKFVSLDRPSPVHTPAALAIATLTDSGPSLPPAGPRQHAPIPAVPARRRGLQPARRPGAVLRVPAHILLLALGAALVPSTLAACANISPSTFYHKTNFKVMVGISSSSRCPLAGLWAASGVLLVVWTQPGLSR
jgi:hypothetical protein